MAKSLILVITATLALTSGCASTASLQKLETRNAALEKRLAQMQKRVYTAQKQAGQQRPAVRQPMPAPLPPPQIAHRMSGIPATFAYLHQRPRTCRGTEFEIEIENFTGHWIALRWNGAPVRVSAGTAWIGHLPPGRVAYLCANEFGRNMLGGESFVGRAPHLRLANRFAIPINVNPNNGGPHYQAIDARRVFKHAIR